MNVHPRSAPMLRNVNIVASMMNYYCVVKMILGRRSLSYWEVIAESARKIVKYLSAVSGQAVLYPVWYNISIKLLLLLCK